MYKNDKLNLINININIPLTWKYTKCILNFNIIRWYIFSNCNVLIYLKRKMICDFKFYYN